MIVNVGTTSTVLGLLVAGSGTNSLPVCKVLQGVHGDTPRYLGLPTGVDDLPGRRTLRSTNANRLVVPPVKLSTVGSRAFAAASPHIWNTLPTDVVAASSLSIFRRLLKRFLFKQLYSDIIYWHHPASGPCSGCTTYATVKKLPIDWLIGCSSVNESGLSWWWPCSSAWTGWRLCIWLTTACWSHPEVDLGPFFFTQFSPTHQLMDPTQPNPTHDANTGPNPNNPSHTYVKCRHQYRRTRIFTCPLMK